LLSLDVPPTVLCCGNDRLAVTVYGILRARGIAVPEAMSVTGYDDYRVISETLYPLLTTMELPYGRMGEQAARLMLEDLRGGATATEQDARIMVRGEMRWRASVTPGPAI
jgi:LacI family transcriptional regulator